MWFYIQSFTNLQLRTMSRRVKPWNLRKNPISVAITEKPPVLRNIVVRNWFFSSSLYYLQNVKNLRFLWIFHTHFPRKTFVTRRIKIGTVCKFFRKGVKTSGHPLRQKSSRTPVIVWTYQQITLLEQQDVSLTVADPVSKFRGGDFNKIW